MATRKLKSESERHPGAHMTTGKLKSESDLLGHVYTLLRSDEPGHKLGHVLASSLRFKGALLLGSVLHDGLHLVVALLATLLEATTSRGTELSRLLGAACDWGVLLHL